MIAQEIMTLRVGTVFSFVARIQLTPREGISQCEGSDAFIVEW